MSARLAAACLLAALAAPAAAQDLVVRAGRWIDVESGAVHADQAIVVKGGRIAAIEPWREGLADGTRVLDWSAATVVPGLMDMHTHMAEDDQGADLAAPLKTSPVRGAFIGARNARATLRAGFTTVRDVGVYRGFADVALRDAINDGLVPGPRMFVAGAYVTVTGGGGELTGLPAGTVVPPEFRLGVADDAATVRRRVDEILDGGADFIKVIATGAVLTSGTEPGEMEYDEDQIRAAVEAAAARGTFVAAHAHGAAGIVAAARAGVRSIEHGSLMDDAAIAEMKAHGTWLVADIYNGDYIDAVGRRDGWSEEILRKNTETTEAQRAGFRKAVAAGVNIAYGTDAGVFPHGDNGRQFEYMVRHGMTPLQALASATIQPARLLGREAELGSIAVGKHADLVAVACDPLADITCLTRIAGVVKAGAPVALD